MGERREMERKNKDEERDGERERKWKRDRVEIYEERRRAKEINRETDGESERDLLEQVREKDFQLI